MKPIDLRIAEELGVREQQAAAAISLLDGGATVPFVARYRKEATGAGHVRLSSDVSEIKLAFSIPPERPAPNIAPSWNVAPTES